jgi:hypothetical protein
MGYTYSTGQEIMKGDRVSYLGEPGEIEFVVDGLIGDPGTDWYVHEYGGGVMVREPKVFRSTFLSEKEDLDDLIFVTRV